MTDFNWTDLESLRTEVAVARSELKASAEARTPESEMQALKERLLDANYALSDAINAAEKQARSRIQPMIDAAPELSKAREIKFPFTVHEIASPVESRAEMLANIVREIKEHLVEHGGLTMLEVTGVLELAKMELVMDMREQS